VQHALIRDHPLGMPVSAGADGLDANPVPFLLDSDAGQQSEGDERSLAMVRLVSERGQLPPSTASSDDSPAR
jgi:hypothetical protein